MADATAEISRENTVNAHRPPQSHVAGLGMNEMKATIEYKDTIVTARLMRKFFILFDLSGRPLCIYSGLRPTSDSGMATLVIYAPI
jgi:hypothetical protein